jgi:hypothetical protein
MKPTVEAVLLEFGISFPIRNEITVAKALVEARAKRDALLEVLEQVRPSVKSAGSAALLGLVDAALTTNTTEAQ